MLSISITNVTLQCELIGQLQMSNIQVHVNWKMCDVYWTLLYNSDCLNFYLPSQELIVHTQNILQNALIKKKLEEQKENFRKRQQMEMHRSKSPSQQGQGQGQQQQQQHGNKQQTSVNAAFTPTSVIKNMHNHRADEKPFGTANPKVQGTRNLL